MKKTICLMLCLLMVITTIAIPVFADPAPTKDLPNLNAGWMLSHSGSFNGKSYTIDQQLDTYIMKFKLSTTDEITGNTWINLKNGSTRLYFEGPDLKAEQTWGMYDFVTIKANAIQNDGVAHDFLIWVDDANVYIYENSGSGYALLGSYINKSNKTGTKISFSSASWDMNVTDLQLFVKSDEPDYINDWNLVKSVKNMTGASIAIDGSYKNFIAEYKIKATSTGNGTISPFFWHQFRTGGTGNNLITNIDAIGQPSNLKYVLQPGTYNYKLAGTTPVLNDEYHTYRVWMNEKVITIDEKVGDAWVRGAQFTYAGDAPVAGGTIKFSNASGGYSTTFTLEYMNVYEEPLALESAANGISFVPLDYSVPLKFGKKVAKNLTKSDLTVKVSGVETDAYSIRATSDNMAYLDFDEDLEGSSIYEITVGNSIIDKETTISFKTGYAKVLVKDADDSRDNWEPNSHDYFASKDGEKMTVINGDNGNNFYGYIKDSNTENIAVRWGQTVDELGTSGNNPLVLARYNKNGAIGRTDVGGTYARVDFANGNIFVWDGVTQNSQYKYDITNFYKEAKRTDTYFAVNGDKMYMYAKNEGDDTYTFLGEKPAFQYTGAGYLAFDCRAKSTTFEDMDVFVPGIVANDVENAAVKSGDKIIVTFNGEVAVCPSTIDVDGVTCNASISETNKKQIELTLTSDLEYDTTYSDVDLSGVKDIYGGNGGIVDITTYAEPDWKYGSDSGKYDDNGADKGVVRYLFDSGVDSDDIVQSKVVFFGANPLKEDNDKFTVKGTDGYETFSADLFGLDPSAPLTIYGVGCIKIGDVYVWSDIQSNLFDFSKVLDNYVPAAN